MRTLEEVIVSCFNFAIIYNRKWSLEILDEIHTLFFISNSFTSNTRLKYANYEYSHSNRENLLLPIQMQLSEKPKKVCGFFIAFLESTLNFEHFEKKKKKK